MSAHQLTRKQYLALREKRPAAWLNIVWGILIAVASYEVFSSSRTWMEIVHSALPIAAGFFILFALVIAGAAWSERPEIAWGELAAALAFALLAAPFLGLLLYVFWSSITDAFLAARAGAEELGQPVTWSHTRALIVGAMIPVGLGACFFGMRLKFRILYGVSEVLVGIIVATFKYVDPARGYGFELALLTGSVYLVVRGLDNIHQGLRDLNDPIVAHLPLLRNRRLNLKLEKVLAGIRTKPRIQPDRQITPLDEISKRFEADPGNGRNITLNTIASAIQERKDAFDEDGVWQLDPEDMGLLEALIQEKLDGHI